MSMLDENGPEPMDVDMGPNDVDTRNIALLIDQLTQEDMQTRVTALRQVTRIAEAIGPQRTRDELIPYLNEMLDDDEEVLKAIADHLIDLRDCVGGAQYLHTLIPPYETLVVVEEATIRNLAIEKLSLIVAQIPDEIVVQHAPDLFERLSSSGWHTARTGAAGLSHILFPRLLGTPHAAGFQDRFLQLAKDNMPQVRRSVAENIAQFARKMNPADVEAVIFPVLLALSEDDQDSVRVRALQALVDIGDLITSPGNSKKLRTSVSALCKDQSWRVRFLAASKFTKICERLESEENSMMDIFHKLLKDGEAEVRAAASTQFPNLTVYISEELIQRRFLSSFRDLSSDENKYTRATFAEVIVAVGSRYSATFIMNHVLPLVLKLLKDDDPQTRLRCLANLNFDVVNPNDLLEAIMPCLHELADDSSWRIRQSVMDMLPKIGGRLGTDMVDEHLKPLIFKLLMDSVEAVRDSGAKTILNISKELKSLEWSENFLVEACSSCRQGNYLRRQTALDTAKYMIEMLSPEICLETILSFLHDPVPNVRFKACVIIGQLAQNQQIPNELVPSILAELGKAARDSDPDVSGYSKLAMEYLGAGEIHVD